MNKVKLLLTYIFGVVLALTVLSCLVGLTGCTGKSSEDQLYKLPAVVEAKKEVRRDLSWETVPLNKRYGKASWSDLIVKEFTQDLALFSTAKDVTRICPKYHSLTDSLKVKALGEFWVAVAQYESGFNEKSSSVDVGAKEDRSTYSDGLYQVSASDKANKDTYKFTWEQLLDGHNNILLSTEILRRQIRNTGMFILPNTHKAKYWAVILDNNKYQKISAIIERTQKYAPECK